VSVVRQIVLEAVEIEKEFLCDSLPCDLVGMNKGMMGDYIEFVSDHLLGQLGRAPRATPATTLYASFACVKRH
jgi:ribonucleotide reductase beta subunit family protein with ferritin-like domain